MKKIIYTIMALCTLAFNVWAFAELSFKQKLSVNQDNAKAIFIDVGAGSLTVSGANTDEILVNTKIYSKKYKSIDDLQEAFEDNMVLELTHKGSTVVFKALNKKKLFGFSNPDISIDVEIVLPKSMNVEIDDGSGNMKISDIDGSLEIDDGSGSTFINNIGGDLSFDDGSGNMEISNIQGNVHIDDGSGSLALKNVGGSVFLDDGSGGINIQNVTGDVTVDDGSGSINITELAGDFHLEGDGSGQIYVNGNKWIADQ